MSDSLDILVEYSKVPALIKEVITQCNTIVLYSHLGNFLSHSFISNVYLIFDKTETKL